MENMPAHDTVQQRPHRVHIIRGMVNTRGKGLEIGPSFRPVVPKKKGFDVEICDHATADELRLKYKNKPVSAYNQIEDVDYVWRGGSLVDLIGQPARYDYIIASHVIEHTTDLIRFLSDMETLLKPDGVLALAVPDKRYCFDYFRPLSTTGGVIQAYIEQRNRHSIATLFDQHGFICRNGTLGSWEKDTPPHDLRLLSNVPSAMAAVESAMGSPSYTDAHAWQFTPSSFRLILSDLQDLNLVNLNEVDFVDTHSCEFVVGLKKGGTRVAVDRTALAIAAMEELAEVALSSSANLRRQAD